MMMGENTSTEHSFAMELLLVSTSGYLLETGSTKSALKQAQKRTGSKRGGRLIVDGAQKLLCKIGGADWKRADPHDKEQWMEFLYDLATAMSEQHLTISEALVQMRAERSAPDFSEIWRRADDEPGLV